MRLAGANMGILRARRWGRMAVLLLAAAVGATAGCAGAPSTTDVGTLYSFWPQFPAEPHIQFLVSYRHSGDIEPPPSSFDRLVFGRDRETLPIVKPYGVAMWDGRIYVCDIRGGGVVVLDLERHRTSVLRTRGLGGLVQPTDITVSDDGMKYVADLQRGVVFVFDAEDRHVGAFGHEGLKPVGIAVLGDELYVCDFSSQSVLVLDRFNGETLRHIGGRGDEDGQFVRPLGVDVDRDGNVYVVDVIRCRLQKFDRYGQVTMVTGQISDTAGSFVRPKHLAVDDDGVIYVVDAAFANVQMFNDEGQVLMFFGSAGDHPGSMELPAGICVTDEGIERFRDYIHPAFEAQRLVIVTNQFGRNKVAVYAAGRLREGASVGDLGPTIATMSTGVREDDDGGADGALPPAEVRPDQLPAERPPEAGTDEDP